MPGGDQPGYQPQRQLQHYNSFQPRTNIVVSCFFCQEVPILNFSDTYTERITKCMIIISGNFYQLIYNVANFRMASVLWKTF